MSRFVFILFIGSSDGDLHAHSTTKSTICGQPGYETIEAEYILASSLPQLTNNLPFPL